MTAASVRESSCAAAAARTRRTKSPKAWLKSITAASALFRGMAISSYQKSSQTGKVTLQV
jgi:hypothetical protein